MSVARALAGLLSARWAIQIVVTLTIPVFMLAHRLPHRPSSRLRGAIAILALFVLCVTPVATGVVRGLGIRESSAVFTVLLAIYALLIMWVYDTGPWPALFCATAGYTLQNLASGLEVLCAILASHRSSGELPEPWANILGFGIPLVVYVVGYLSFVRQIDRNGLAGVSDKSMLAMFLVVVLVIINFDILIKSLSWGSVKYTSLILLRMVHSVLCAFVLFAEYEILYARRMSDEKAETERLLAERQRQYRLSKENIDAINIKCHDIRHQIRHFADKGDVVDREALKDIARGQRVRLGGRDRQRGPGHHSHREEPGLLPGEHHALVHCRRRLAGLYGPVGHLLVLWQRPGQRHRGHAYHRGPGAPQHIAQRGPTRGHGGRERRELLRRRAAL